MRCLAAFLLEDSTANSMSSASLGERPCMEQDCFCWLPRDVSVDLHMTIQGFRASGCVEVECAHGQNSNVNCGKVYM